MMVGEGTRGPGWDHFTSNNHGPFRGDCGQGEAPIATGEGSFPAGGQRHGCWVPSTTHYIN